jgi:hypothetical protein
MHGRAVSSQMCGNGRSESPSAAVACLKCRLNSVAPDGDGAARRRGCNHSALVSAVTRDHTPPLAAEASKAAIPPTLNPAAPLGRKLRGRKHRRKFSGCRLVEGNKLSRQLPGRKQTSAAGGRRAAEFGCYECAVSSIHQQRGDD